MGNAEMKYNEAIYSAAEMFKWAVDVNDMDAMDKGIEFGAIQMIHRIFGVSVKIVREDLAYAIKCSK